MSEGAGIGDGEAVVGSDGAAPSRADPHGLRDLVARARSAGGAIDLHHCVYGPASGSHERFIDRPLPYHAFLAGFCRLVGARRILEIGTHYGGSAIAMVHGMRAAGVENGGVVTIDVTDFRPAAFREFPEIATIIADASDPRVIEEAAGLFPASQIDLVYVDALKDRAFVKTVLHHATRRLVPTWLILDDIANGASMQQMWAEMAARFGHRALDISAVMPDVRAPETGFGLVRLLPGDIPLEAPDAVPKTPARAAPLSVGTFSRLKQAGAWREGAVPAEPMKLKGMMRGTEVRMLHRLARHVYSGRGEIVDAGVFLGRSTLALANGLHDNPAVARKERRIHSYDAFENSNPGYDRLLENFCAAGESFVAKFMDNIKDYSYHINVYPGDIKKQRWIGLPIEICFVDICKDVEINSWVYTQLAPFWVPKQTLYIQQDFVHLGVPAVHYVLGFLADHFVVIDVVVPSLVLGVRSVPPPWKLARIAADDFTAEEKVGFVERLEPLLPGDEARGTTLLVAASLGADVGLLDVAARLFRRVLDAYKHGDKSYLARIDQTRKRLLRRLPPGAIPEADSNNDGE